MADFSRRGFLSAAAALAASDTIRVGLLGTGGRCRHLLRSLLKLPSVRVVAACDVWDSALAETLKMLPPSPFTTKEYREVLSRKDVDVVLITTPDHWHVPMTIDAVAAGKDVYVEKPLTHELSEGPRVIEAVNRTDRVVQIGMQQRSMPHLTRAREILQSGQLGKIYKVHMTWNRNANRGARGFVDVPPASVDWPRFLGNAPQQPFNPLKMRNWRFFWDFGNGILTDLMVHWLDVVHWMLDLDYPDAAATIGDHFAPQWGWETPDTIQTFLHYKRRGVQAYFEGTFVNARNAAMTEFMGDIATLYIDRGRFEIHPEKARGKEAPAYSDMILGEGGRGADFYETPDGELLHLEHWLECVRTRRKPNTPVEVGVTAAAAAHLGNIAYRQGKVAYRKEYIP
jgi:predicted dehydrogenase